ncbi:MAG: agmatine deiminase family protein [Gammaproteobacteria bacterium]
MPKPNNRRVPAEWELQSVVQLTWPHTNSDWVNDLIAVEQTFACIATEVSRRQLVIVVCHSHDQIKHITGLIKIAGGDTDRLYICVTPSNDTWARDHGPISVLDNSSPRLLDFRFNGWGGRYPAKLDNMITQNLDSTKTFGDTPVDSIDLELEGGALDFDGHGTLLTTRSCLIDARDTKSKTQEEFEEIFFELFGVVETHWLQNGRLEGDDTDGHIDTLARFTDVETIAYQGCDNTSDCHYEPLRRMASELKSFQNFMGKPYRLVELPLPAPVYDKTGNRLPATYANFLVINEAVLVPTYADPADTTALKCLQTCFPDRTIIGIDCRSLIQQFGSLHCATMHYPASVVPNLVRT